MYDTTKPYLAEIKRIMQTTWNTKYLRVDKYGVRRKFGAPSGVEYRTTDGIGTKGEDHWPRQTFKEAAQDALAMGLNDACRDRAIIFELCDHIFVPFDDHQAIISIVSHVADQCRSYDIAITAGETAIHEGSKGLEISITMLGVKRSLVPNEFHEGDILIGIASSGMHSNGFTRLHGLYDDWESPPDDITTPTLIYYHCITSIDRVLGIHGMTHITGGAFTKMKEHLGAHDAYIHRQHKFIPHPIFSEITSRGVSEEEMYRTFNCGIGFVIGVDSRFVHSCLSVLNQEFKAAIIGEVKAGNGMVHIESMFSDKVLHY